MATPGLDPADDSPKTRDELVTMVARAHKSSDYADATLTGRTLAAQSKLPKVIAENLGAGFGQWDFFPEAAEIVDFALGYVSPATAEELWGLARAWASDDATARPTLMTLVGREIVQHELRRIDVAPLRELLAETRPTQARALREALGLPVAALAPAKTEQKRKAAAPATPRAPRAAAAAAPADAETAAPTPARMPKPELRRPPKAAPPPAARKFQHPKFGEGVLAAADGVGPDAKLTIKFESGSKTLLARYVTELLT
jgi:hypothetical protein